MVEALGYTERELQNADGIPKTSIKPFCVDTASPPMNVVCGVGRQHPLHCEISGAWNREQRNRAALPPPLRTVVA
jgi:hypothetical protein